MTETPAEEARRRLNLWLRYGNPRPNPISDEGRQFENDLQLLTEAAAPARVLSEEDVERVARAISGALNLWQQRGDAQQDQQLEDCRRLARAALDALSADETIEGK